MTGGVLHVLKFFRPRFTGAGIFLERATLLFDRLAPGVEHDVLVVDTPRPQTQVRAKSALREIFYLQDGNTMSPWRAEFALVWWLLRNIWSYQVVHFQTHADRFFLGYFLVKLCGRRLVFTATLDDSVPQLIKTYRPFYRPLIRMFLQMFDIFITISPKLYDESVPMLRHGRVHLIPIGVAVPAALEPERESKRAAYGLSGGDLALIFVGGICARKDPLFLVEQMPALCVLHPQMKLVIVGPVLEPEHHERMLAFIGAHGLEDRVIFTGEVRDPYPLFAMSDIVVFASHLEGFGCAVTEGMAHGLPAVVRQLPGVNDLFIREGETGFFFNTPEEYVAGIRRLIEDPALRREMGAAARNLIAGEFDDLRNAKRIMALYGITAELPQGAEVHA